MINKDFEEIIQRLVAIEERIGTPPSITVVQHVDGWNWWLLIGVFLTGFTVGFGLYQLQFYLSG
jgi:hypothetical protein